LGVKRRAQINFGIRQIHGYIVEYTRSIGILLYTVHVESCCLLNGTNDGCGGGGARKLTVQLLSMLDVVNNHVTVVTSRAFVTRCRCLQQL